MPGVFLLGWLSGFFLSLVLWPHGQLGPCFPSLTGMTTRVWLFSNVWHCACQARSRVAYVGLLLVEPFHRVENWLRLEAGALTVSRPWSSGPERYLSQARIPVSCRNWWVSQPPYRHLQVNWDSDMMTNVRIPRGDALFWLTCRCPKWRLEEQRTTFPSPQLALLWA